VCERGKIYLEQTPNYEEAAFGKGKLVALNWEKKATVEQANHANWGLTQIRRFGRGKGEVSTIGGGEIPAVGRKKYSRETEPPRRKKRG